MIRVLSVSLTLLLLTALTVTVLEAFAAPGIRYELQVQRGAQDRPDQGVPAPRGVKDRPDQGIPAPRGQDPTAPRLDVVAEGYKPSSIEAMSFCDDSTDGGVVLRIGNSG